MGYVHDARSNRIGFPMNHHQVGRINVKKYKQTACRFTDHWIFNSLTRWSGYKRRSCHDKRAKNDYIVVITYDSLVIRGGTYDRR